MIKSKLDYQEYLRQDKVALGLNRYTFNSLLKGLILPDYIIVFQFLMRRLEYLKNCKSSVFSKVEYLILYISYNKLSIKLGFSIPLNVFGAGLAIAHYGTIVVNSGAKVGTNCRLHPSTCVGASGGTSKAPQIGNNVYIGPGAKIYGDIVIGNNSAIAANAAVNKSFMEDGILIGGVPAKMISKIDISTIIKHVNL